MILAYYYKSSLVPLIMPREFKIRGKFWSCHGKNRFQDNITTIPKCFATGKYISWQRCTCATNYATGKYILWQTNTFTTGKLISWQTSTCATNLATGNLNFLWQTNSCTKDYVTTKYLSLQTICATNYFSGKYLSWKIKTYRSRLHSHCVIVL